MEAGRQVAIIVLVFVAGMTTGYTSLVQDYVTSTFVTPLLLLLVFLIGIEAGASGRVSGEEALLGVAIAVVALPMSMLGGAFAAALANDSPNVGALVGGGMGWYTFDGPLLDELAGPREGYLGFTSNLLRETLTIIVYPLLPRRLRIAGISLGGATTMDTTLPIVRASAGRRASVIALVHGTVLTMILPVVLPFTARLLGIAG